MDRTLQSRPPVNWTRLLRLLRKPRERAIERGVPALGDAELIAIVLGTGSYKEPVLQVAGSLLRQYNGLHGLALAGLETLTSRRGLGPAKALRLLAGIELGRRCTFRASRGPEPISSSASVYARFGPALGSIVHEEMWILVLDPQNVVRATRQIALGGIHACSMQSREILRATLSEGGSGFVLIHNHPSRDPNPSVDDIRMTRRLATACEILGVHFVDHVIIGSEEGYSSMLDLGILKRPPDPIVVLPL